MTDLFLRRVGVGAAFVEVDLFVETPSPMKYKFITPLSLSFAVLSFSSHVHSAVIAQQDFETTPGTPTLSYTTTGTWALQSGSVTGTLSPSDSTWGASGRGIGSDNNTTATIVFDSIDTSGYSAISLAFRLAALSGTGSNANGMELGDTFKVEVSPNGGTNWYLQSTITGSSSSNARWSFAGASGLASVSYTTGAATTFTPGGGGIRTTDGYTNISVTGLPSVSSLRVRLTALDDNANERWLVDSLVVSGTAVPEPAAALLGSIGLLGLLRRRRLI